MNNKSDEKSISIINFHCISDNGRITSTRYDVDYISQQVLRKKSIPSQESSFLKFGGHLFDFNNRASSGDQFLVNNNGENNACCEQIQVFKFENGQDVDQVKRVQKINIPNMIRCQNCETNYPTKYQYQRHQCEFNAEKVVLKPNADFIDLEKGIKRIKYDCPTCGKQFVSKNNLERHETSHENSKDNTCEHCKKQFVSENRLRIHKENHCKKAGDISKFYRSDVTVWKCKKCHEVFSSSTTAGFHVELCNDLIDVTEIKQEPISAEDSEVAEDPQESTQTLPDNNKTIEKISTEILLQCEFCNRTYADKQVLLKHQKTHKTDKNYECVICKEIFTSYITASQHWLKKCSEKANLFYLPKLTYCEFCDRTFKSHEILYTHKIKKKHYTPKLFTLQEVNQVANPLKEIKNERAIDKLIEDVLRALEIPINKRNKKQEIKDKENVDPENLEETIKSEPTSQPNEENEDEVPLSIIAEKKKRGRKRKLPKQQPKNKKLCAALEDGFKYQCERCTEVFETISELEIHREKEHAANFNCDECGQVLHSARALLIHSRAHKSLKPYVCDTCGRSYSQTSHLWQHMRFHQGIKPFACPHEGCEARYTIRPDLKDHIRKVHTRERPFKCSVCGKCFLTGSVYYQHRLIHTEDRRYGCDMCEKRFFRADALNNHKRIHTNERPYPCFVCGRLFRQKGDRNKHFRTQHPDAILN